ncbi:sulfatase [Aquisphaera insulae]|uniref:sulfatase n=1 Tax=Aquisphaera insulae TaxID=2712864 RepID=UPI00196B0A1D|nr:sulfatase [Aquisphaera insulae]
MNRRLTVATDLESEGSPPAGPRTERPGLVEALVLSAWCGLVAGLLEVGTIEVQKRLFDPNKLYHLTRHFVWLIPLTYLGLFLALGFLGWIVGRVAPRRGWWSVKRFLCALVLLPMALIAFPRVYTLAWLVLALGVATKLVPVLESRGRWTRRVILASFPPALAIPLILAGALWLGDRRRQAEVDARAMPATGSPNVLLIVLDTVAAGHLSLYGYPRPTSGTLVELAGRGIRFDAAQAASSWTLPSHATMFTGRWMHELSVGWLNPLDGSHSTLAEFLAARGYATAGFVGNTMYCSRDSGLNRGFAKYEDYIFPAFTAPKTAVMVNRLLAVLGKVLPFVEARPELLPLQPYVQRAWQSLVFDRKDAASVNREFLGWLAGRGDSARPFFAFLNYSDAHTPYELPEGRIHRFGEAQPDDRQRELIRRWGELDKIRLVERDQPLLVDAYDDCVADLDEQLGKLMDRLQRLGVLGRTWVIVASDHGESFGEHTGVFCHGTSLYQTEVHVPLLIIPPGESPIATPRVVKETVSLRDIAATITDLVGLAAESPFPGESLARTWGQCAGKPAPPSGPIDGALSEVLPGLANNIDENGLPLKSWPLGALKDGEWSYIRGNPRLPEELFHLSTDGGERHNVARDPASRPILDRMRQALDRLTAGPLVPQRFNR